MSLYREAGRRRRWLLPLSIALAAALGFVAGFFGRGGDGSTSLASAVERLQREVKPALDGLELVRIEYREAVRDGSVAAPSEYAAARADVGRAREVVARIRADLAVLDASAAGRAEAQLTDLAALVERRAPPGQVEAQAKLVTSAISTAARLP